MSESYRDTERKPVLTRLAPDVYGAALAIARAEHVSLSALVARAVEADLLARAKALQGINA